MPTLTAAVLSLNLMTDFPFFLGHSTAKIFTESFNNSDGGGSKISRAPFFDSFLFASFADLEAEKM